MPRTADKDLPRRKKLSGKRLKEVMELREYTPKVFLMTMKSRYGKPDDQNDDGYLLDGFDTSATLYRVLNGTRTLQIQHARYAAEILDIDVNYLLGTVDNFDAKSYAEYEIRYLKQDKLRADWQKHTRLLNMAGAKVLNTFYDENDNLIGYCIFKDGRRADFTAAEMDRHMSNFFEDLCEYAKKRFDPIMDLGKVEPPTPKITIERGPITDEDLQEGR